MNNELKTSAEWQATKEFSDVVIYDADGWRDKSRPCDFYHDRITKQDFTERKSLCTLMLSSPKKLKENL